MYLPASGTLRCHPSWSGQWPLLYSPDDTKLTMFLKAEAERNVSAHADFANFLSALLETHVELGFTTQGYCYW